MAERRMFSRRICSSGRFLKMPASAQNLYFHLGLYADDDGIVEAYSVVNSTGATDSDLDTLIDKGFIVVLNEDLVSYITDWNENNQIRSDRKVDSIYQDLLLQNIPDVQLKNRRSSSSDNQVTTKCQPSDNQATTKCPQSIGKDSIGKDSIDKYNDISPASPPKNVRHKYGQYKNVLLSDADMEKLKAEFPNDYQQRIETLSEYIASTGRKYKNFLATIRTWARKEKGASNHNGETNTVTAGEFIPTRQDNFHIDRTNLFQD